MTIMILVNRFQGFSRGVFIMDAVFTILFISGSRASIRLFLHRTAMRRQEGDVRKRRLLVIGAGDAAEKTVREIEDNPNLPYEVIGFVDDDPDKTGLRIHRIPVLGTVDDLPIFAEQTKADELLIAVVTLTGPQMKRIVGFCQQTGLPFKVLPGLGELINGKVSVSAIRDISYKDLLGRDEVTLDQNQIGEYLRGKIVLVTGAGGSIGSELCRQIIRFSPARLILFDSSEENLYAIQMELLHEFQITDAVPVLGRVQDVRLLDQVFRRNRPEVVFHAAAYKHVPLIENNPWEAVHNNIIASQFLIEAVIRHRVDRFVLVSTDKAVRPTNVMGASKRLTELLMLTYARHTWDGMFSKCLAESTGNGRTRRFPF
jgi:FlaA1/EpsC-like NDP-sugar epimerase